MFILALAVAILAMALGGCGNVTGPEPCVGDDCPGTPPPPPYPIRNSPIKAVEYMRLAWENRDSVAADSVLSDEYEGTSTDIGETTVTLSFLKSDEIRALHELKDAPNITKLTMTFGPQASWILDQYPGDPPDWVVVKVNEPNILLELNDLNNQIVPPGNTDFEFKTRPVVSGSQTLWEVVGWKEVHTKPPNT